MDMQRNVFYINGGDIESILDDYFPNTHLTPQEFSYLLSYLERRLGIEWVEEVRNEVEFYLENKFNRS